VAKTLTGVIPNSVVVKLLTTLAGTGGTGTTCANSAATATERSFRPAVLSAGKLAGITGPCAAIIGNGSGFGICRNCQAGALGAGKN